MVKKGSMSSSIGTRNSRSRFNSPAQATPSTNASNDSQIATADDSENLGTWQEPALAPPRPSFSEAGIERHGAVLNMAALGTLPSSKVLKALQKGHDGTDGLGRGRRGTSTVSTPLRIMTPEPATTSTPILSQAPSPVQSPSQAVSPSKTEEMEDAPRTPRLATPQKMVTIPDISSGIPGTSYFAINQSPIAQSYTHPYHAVPQSPVLGPDGLPFINLTVTDRIVEVAVNDALDERRWPTAYAIRIVYDEYRGNLSTVRLFDAIYHQRASDEEKREFNRLISKEKREGKKDRTAEYYFNCDGIETTPVQSSIISAIASINPPPKQPYKSLYGGSVSGETRSSSVLPSSMPASPKVTDHEHISKKARSNSFQPIKAEVQAISTAVMNGRSASQPNGMSRGRNGSQSSSSSLSSVDEKILDAGPSPKPPRFINNYPIFAPPASGSYKSPYASTPVPVPVSVPVSVSAAPSPTFVSPYTSANNFAAAGGSSSPAETLARNNQPPPISAPIKNGPKTFVFKVTTTTAISSPSSAVANSSSSANNTTTTTALNNNNKKSSTIKSSMAPAALLDSSQLSSASSTQSSFKAKKVAAKVTVLPQVEVIHDQSSRLKRRAREHTDSVTKDKTEKSFERHQVREPEYDSATDGGNFVTVAASKRPPKVRLVTKTRETRQRANDDSDSLSSPGFSNFVPDFAKESAPSSRAATPNPSGRPTRKAKGSSHLRVKSSPMKKKPGTSAGIARPGGEQSPVGIGAAQDDNNDYCSACGGNGDLVCCDGFNCKRSFHFKCVDPPVLEGGLPDESWFCNQCSDHHENGVSESESRYNGPFGPLIWTLEVKNPSAFHLPKHIRELFDQVKTGENGEYENDAPVKPKSRTGYEEAPDYFRKKDAKGKLILCHLCHKTAEPPARMIIPCAFCSLYWHMDCVDVPLAKEPGPGRQWRCPAHVDDLLVALPESLAPAHRYRKIKNASVIKPTFSRGLRNNGYIEIENDATDNEQEQGFYEQRQYGHVYKLPEQGIKLDFLAKARQYGGGLPSYDRAAKPPSTPVVFSARDLEMQQAALNLAALQSQNTDQDQTSLLINTLLSQAPPTVISMLAQVQSDELIFGQKMSRPSRQLLQNLRDILNCKLGESQSGDEDGFGRRTLTPPSTEKGSTKASDQEINGDKDGDTMMLL